MIAVGLVLVVVLGVSRFVVLEWRQMRQAEQGLQAVHRLRVSLVLAEMVSRERGPMNGVLGDASAANAALRERLKQARARTDQAYAAFDEVVSADDAVVHDPLTARQAAAFRAALQLARTEVDRVADLPPSQRSTDSIRQAVRGMVDLVPLLAPAITQFADDAQLADPSLGSSVWGARMTAELREYAGLLGSLFTPALTRQQPFSREEFAAIAQVNGRIEELRHLVGVRVGQSQPSDAIMQAHAQVERRYFGKAAQLLKREGKGLALATQCIGGGQGIATILEAV